MVAFCALTPVLPSPVVSTVLHGALVLPLLPSSYCLPFQGQKRLVLSESCSRDSLSSQPSCTGLNYSYGVNAWKCWVQSKYANGETSKGDELRFGRKYLGGKKAQRGKEKGAILTYLTAEDV